jgi:teichuronic acid biosynthesis glycosyltransferase TuaG
MTPRASFVIPAFNAERWISKSIFSCRNQTEKKIEIIVVDDASTDDTAAIIQAHIQGSEATGAPDPRVKHIRLETNGMSGHARNVGNDAAQSEYILMMDADDLSTRDRVKLTIATFELKKAGLVYGAYYVMDSLGNTATEYKVQPFNAELSKKERYNFICHSTMAYTKELASKVRYDEDVWVKLRMEDWKFQWDAHKAGAKFFAIKSPLCYLRVSQGTQSSLRNEEEITKTKDAYLAAL